MERDQLDRLTQKIIGLAIDVHKRLGPGFIEKIYEKALACELRRAGIKFYEQADIKVKYKNLDLGCQRVDFMMDGVILELKSVSEINEIHEAQMLSYLKTADKRVGLILNFAKKKLDIKRMVNHY